YSTVLFYSTTPPTTHPYTLSLHDALPISRVVFNITEGPVVKIHDIDFAGNTFVSGPVLRTHIRSGKEWFHLFGGKFNPTLADIRSEEHTSELQSRSDLVCRLLLEKKKKDR